MNEDQQDLLNLRKQIEERLNAPDLRDHEKAELFVALNSINKHIRTQCRPVRSLHGSLKM